MPLFQRKRFAEKTSSPGKNARNMFNPAAIEPPPLPCRSMMILFLHFSVAFLRKDATFSSNSSWFGPTTWKDGKARTPYSVSLGKKVMRKLSSVLSNGVGYPFGPFEEDSERLTDGGLIGRWMGLRERLEYPELEEGVTQLCSQNISAFL